MQKDKNTSFVGSAMILTLGGLLVKILGAVYKIPLGNLLGDEGSAYQGFAFPYYNFMVSIITAGFPIAIAKLVSEYTAIGDELQAEKVFKATRRMMIVIGAVLSAVLFTVAPIITGYLGIPDAAYTMQGLAIAVFFVSISFSYKSYFQGKQNLTPYAIADVLEQATKVVVGLALVVFLMKYGLKIASAGATFAVAIGAIISAGVLIFASNRYRKNYNIKNIDSITKEEYRDIYKKVLAIAIPVTVGAVIINFINMIESAIVIERLKDIGFSAKDASVRFGYYSYYSGSLIGFPQILFSPISVAIFPVIASLVALNKTEEFKKTLNVGIKVVLLIALPCAAGFFTLSTEVLTILWPRLTDMILYTAPVLQIMSFMLICLSVYGITTTVLNGLGKPHLPSINMVIGSIMRVIICYILAGVPSVGYLAAPIGSVSAFAIAMSLNLYHINKYSKVEISFKNTIFKPLLAAVSMGAMVIVSKLVLSNFISNIKIIGLAGIAVGVVSYVVFLVLFKCIGSEELEFLPAKRILSKVFK